MKDRVCDVKNAMLAIQRFPWEQGTCAQALYELGDIKGAVAMAHDAVLRQKEDGRLAVINANIAVTDPASNGEAVWRAYEITKDEFYKNGAEKMLNYLMEKAPKTPEGIIFHNEVSFQEEFTPDQIWVDSFYMAPPFLAVMGQVEYAFQQIQGYFQYLKDEETGLLYHIYDVTGKRFVRKKLWATGNGWALMGIGRIIDTALEKGYQEIAKTLIAQGTQLLDDMLPYQMEDGRFHDILVEEDSFADGASAMMCAAFIYRGCANGWLDNKYLKNADKVAETMENYIDEYGIIHEVCGCPDFLRVGTSAESMASYLMMHAWRRKISR